MSFTIKADYSPLFDLAKGLNNATDLLGTVGVASVNKVADKAFDRSKQAITSSVALPRSYVDDRMQLTLATDAQPTATITGRTRPTTLARFSAIQVIKTASPRAKGDAMRRIPAGSKAAGVSVNVKTGAARAMLPYAFLVPIKAGNIAGGNGMGVFTRTGPGKDDIRHRYGPSIDQVLNRVFPEMEPEIAQELQGELLQEAEKAIEKALPK